MTDAIRASVAQGICVLIAPAGFGKTEALRDALGAGVHLLPPLNVDVSPETVARTLIETVAPRARRSLAPLLQRPNTPENRTHLASWCASRLRVATNPIVFDDFEVVTSDNATVEFVRLVIDQTLPNVKWVIASREKPDLPIATWISRNVMSLPLAADDLAFTRDESERLARGMNVEISPEPLDALTDDLGDWPFALRVALLAWSRTHDIAPLRERTRSVLFEFVERQILAKLSEDEIRLVEFAAYLPEIKPAMLAALGFVHSSALVTRLSAKLPFLIQLNSGSYRIHHILRDGLIERDALDEDVSKARVLAIAEALYGAMYFDEALNFFQKAGAWERALDVLLLHGFDRLENGNRVGVTAALKAFPRAFAEHPIVLGLRGALAHLDWKLEAAERDLKAALAADLPVDFRSRVVLNLGSVYANTRRFIEVIAIYRQLIADDNAQIEDRLRAASTVILAETYPEDTALIEEATSFCIIGLSKASIETRAFVHYCLSYRFALRRSTRLARTHVLECIDLAESIGHDLLIARGFSVLAMVQDQLGNDMRLQRRYMESCLNAALACGSRGLEIWALETLLAIASETGDDDLYDDSYARLQAARGSTRTTPAHNMTFGLMHEVVKEVGIGSRSRAVSLLKSLSAPSLSTLERAFRDALLALLHAPIDRDVAEKMLQQVPLTSVPDDYSGKLLFNALQSAHVVAKWLLGRRNVTWPRPALDEAHISPRTVRLNAALRELVAIPISSLSGEDVDRITEPLFEFGHGGTARFYRQLLAPVIAKPSPLTRTELEVLRELKIRGGTTDEVAQRMGKSSGTVLTHLRSACAKLEVSGRAEAVSYAVNKGWIS